MRRPPIGALRRRVRLEAPVTAPDGAGGVIESWTLLAQVWAAILPASGQETLTHDRYVGHLTHEVWLRARDDVRPACRLVDASQVLEIQAVLEEPGPGLWLKCMTVERRL